MLRHTSTFTALGDDGCEYTLHVYTNYISKRTLSDGNREVEGIKQVQTSDGKKVNCLGNGNFRIVSTGVNLHSDDPVAPR
jgi:hypothetical protein